jgi:hypothetical protein
MLLAYLILADPIGTLDRWFRVSHIVEFENGFLSANQVTRSGTLFGSAGGGNAHSGTYREPLFLFNGNLRKVEIKGTSLDCGQTELLGKLSASEFVFQVNEPSKSGLYRAIIVGSKVRNNKRTNQMPPKSEWAHRKSTELFDPRTDPAFGFQDVADNGTTSWYKIPHGFQIGSHECEAGIALGTQYGIGLKLKNGKRVPFRNQLSRLNGMESRRLIYVSPKGWFVVMMDSSNDDRFLVWIEPTQY